MNWMHSCRQVAALLTRRFDEPLGLADRIRLRLHLWMCDDCRRIEQQLRRLNVLSAELMDAGLEADDPPPPSGSDP
jgi:hypothetical protein